MMAPTFVDSAKARAPLASASLADGAAPGAERHADTFLSRDFHELASQVAQRGQESGSSGPDFDLLIIGSGYGAAMAATVFAGRTLIDPATQRRRPARISMLERGTERLPGAFPERFADLPGEVRIQSDGAVTPQGVRTGLFDLRAGPDLAALVANGLGGGSLINAGVMLTPRVEVFGERGWPEALRGFPDDLKQAYADADKLLGAVDAPVGSSQSQTLAKLARPLGPAVAVPVTVQFDDQTDRHPVRTSRCIRCGDCATGCNHNAKLSLDVTALPLATRQPGFQIFTGATVLRFDPAGTGGWFVHVVPTGQPQRARLARPLRLHCTRLLLAAGSLGSTELMLRSRRAHPALGFSPQLGNGISGNGDLIAMIADLDHRTGNVGPDGIAPGERSVGPTISGMVDLRTGRSGAVFQALAIPHPLRRLLAETLGLVRVMGAFDGPGAAPASIASVDDEALERSLVFAVIGDDQGRGIATLNDRSEVASAVPASAAISPDPVSPPCDIDVGDGAISIRWLDGHRPAPDYAAARLAQLGAMARQGGPRARAYADPLSRPMGAGLTGSAAGPAMTVHPLGGCPMGGDWHQGVVDDLGRVFRRAGAGDGGSSGLAATPSDELIVLDGSIVPVALGINPALTIAALALRASRRLADFWNWQSPAAQSPATGEPSVDRPRARAISPATISEPRPTELELIERLEGPAMVQIDGKRVAVQVELTLRSLPFVVRGAGGRIATRIELSAEARDEPIAPRLPAASFLRIYRREHWAAVFEAQAALAERDAAVGNPSREAAWLERRLRAAADPEGLRDEIAWVKLPVSGHIDLFHDAAPGPIPSALAGWWHWLQNDGFRWIWQSARARAAPVPDSRSISSDVAASRGRSLWQRLVTFNRVMGYAGLAQDMGYELRIEASARSDNALEAALANASVLSGRKRMKYQYAANPWRQLMQVRLLRSEVIGPVDPGRNPVVLDLAPAYLAWTRTPLIAVVDEDNHVDGIADLAAFLLEAGRRVLLTQFPAFVKPDASARPASPLSPRLPLDDDGFEMADADRVRLKELGGAEGHRLARYLPGLHCSRYLVDVPWRSTDWLDADPVATGAARGDGDGIGARSQPAALLTRYQWPAPVAGARVAGAGPDSAPGPDTVLSGQDPGLPPIVLIHGYSASGTTFAHPALAPSLAETLARQGRDVWVLDLRSSSGFRSVAEPWSFEDLAFGDLPLAVETVLRLTGASRVDVVAHCMGAAMLSLALLGTADPDSADSAQAAPGYVPLAGRIRRLVLSQAGPVMRFNGANLFRAYAMQLWRHALPGSVYALQPRVGNLADELFDRLLTTLPYPDARDFATEKSLGHPTPWTAMRHRLDAVFGRTFRADRIPRAVLDNLDDFFGPFSLRTIGQSVWFARYNRVTNAYGDPDGLTEERFARAWPLHTHAIHGAENGIFDPLTLVQLRWLFDRCGIAEGLSTDLLIGQGHQDGFIGDPRSVGPLQRSILGFLMQP